MTQVSGSTVWGIAERIVISPVGRVRSEIVRLLGQRGFTLSTDQLTVLEGQRGSALAGAGRNAAKVPVQIRARLTAGDPGCAIWLEVRDGWRLPMSRPVAVYQDIITEVIQALDEALRRLDPEAEEFGPVQRSWHAAYAYADSGDDADTAVSRMAHGVNRYLDHDAGDAPRGWSERGVVSVVTPRGVADLRVDTLYAMVTVGTLVAARPGPMPAKLVSQVEQTVGMFERMLEHAAGWQGNTWIELDEKAVPVVEFLVQQAKIREAVPLRTLQVCVTCRLAKVVNPDYARLRSRTNKLRTLQSGLGAVISLQGISPFVLIGKLTQLNQLDPEFVCPRCQGLHADNSIITFCPHCGEQRDEAALRNCRKCDYDFRTLAKTTSLWRELEQIPESAVVPGQFGTVEPGYPVIDPVFADGVPVPAALPEPTPFPDAGAYAAAAGQPANVDAPYPGGWTYPAEGYPVPMYQHESAPAAAFGEPGAEQPMPYVPPAAVGVPTGPQYPAPAAYPIADPAAWSAVPGGGPDGGQGGFAVRSDAALAVDGLHLLPAWYPDPSGRHEFRWWDGQGWAEFVLDQDQSSVDPL